MSRTAYVGAMRLPGSVLLWVGVVLSCCGDRPAAERHVERHVSFEAPDVRVMDSIKFGDFMGLVAVDEASALAQLSDPLASTLVPEVNDGNTFIKDSSKKDTLDAWLGPIDVATSDKDVPNLVHFIHVTDKSPEWNYFNFLHVNAAMAKFKPEALYIYYNAEPHGEHWQETISMPGVHRVHIDKSMYTTWLGHPVHVGAHHADKLRLMALLKHGGVYLDTDVLSLRDLAPLRSAAGRGGSKCAFVGREPGGIGNSLIGSTPNCAFMRLWWQNYTDFDDKQWGEHSIIRPGRIASDHPDLVKVMPTKTFTPFYPVCGGSSCGRNAPKIFEQSSREASDDMPGIQALLFNTPSLLQGAHRHLIQGKTSKDTITFTMHLFGQYNQEALAQVTETSRCTDDTVYNRLTQLTLPCKSSRVGS